MSVVSLYCLPASCLSFFLWLDTPCQGQNCGLGRGFWASCLMSVGMLLGLPWSRTFLSMICKCSSTEMIVCSLCDPEIFRGLFCVFAFEDRDLVKLFHMLTFHGLWGHTHTGNLRVFRSPWRNLAKEPMRGIWGFRNWKPWTPMVGLRNWRRGRMRKSIPEGFGLGFDGWVNILMVWLGYLLKWRWFTFLD